MKCVLLTSSELTTIDGGDWGWRSTGYWLGEKIAKADKALTRYAQELGGRIMESPSDYPD